MGQGAKAIPDEAVEGMLFEVKRGAVDDGPGLRTTVFLKGCPLQCPWCHNPEGVSPESEVWFLHLRCIGCGACVEACPEGAIAPGTRGDRLPDRGLCTVCGRCVDVCPAGARTIVGFTVSAGELVRELARDRVFFETSGGGVTFSGGEPLMQPEFLMDCLSACKREGLHTVLETCGYTGEDILLSAAALCDLVLFDIKHLDEAEHERLTGVRLAPILSNLHALDRTGTHLWLRIPLIPDLNDGQATVDQLAALVDGLQRRPCICLLPYHRAGAAKYARLGRGYPLQDASPPEAAAVEVLAERLRGAGLHVQVGG